MKERPLIIGIVSVLVGVVVLATGNTDLIYVAASIAFFGLCIAYAEWCGRL